MSGNIGKWLLIAVVAVVAMAVVFRVDAIKKIVTGA